MQQRLSHSGRSFVFVFCLLTLIACISTPASAQQINSITTFDTYVTPAWNYWDSIWGASLPVGSDTYVKLVYPASYIGGYGSAQNTIKSSSDHQTYWFDSDTQINVYLFAAPSSNPVPGCVAELGGLVCDSVTVCGSGLCSNTYTTTLSGTP